MIRRLFTLMLKFKYFIGAATRADEEDRCVGSILRQYMQSMFLLFNEICINFAFFVKALGARERDSV